MANTTTTRARKPRALTEAQIQKACTDFLVSDGWRALQTNPCSDRGRGKGFGEIGMADHLYLRPADIPYYAAAARTGQFTLNGQFPVGSTLAAAQGQILWVEFKAPGKKPESHQYLWHLAERVHGFLTVMAGVDFEASYEGFVDWYFYAGLARRPF
jgi:hypothetical protein